MTYLNRSGSTLLSKELDENFDVFVSIEAQFINRLVRKYKLPFSSLEFEKFKSDLFSESKFRSWKISQERLENRFHSLTFPIRLREVLDVILEEATENKHSEYTIVKSGKHFKYYELLKAEYQDSTFIFIKRDPRAIFNSASKSIDSRTKKVMQDNVLRFCYVYKRSMRQVNMLAKRKDFLIVGYEELVTNKESVLSKVSEFLELPIVSRESRYHGRIPEGQKHLHGNLGSSLLQERIKGWAIELGAREIYLIERLIDKEMLLGGYNRLNPTVSVLTKMEGFLYQLFLKIVFLGQKLG